MLSDCPKCWNTPCTCGHQYKNYSKEQRKKLASAVLGIPPDSLKTITFEKSSKRDDDSPMIFGGSDDY